MLMYCDLWPKSSKIEYVVDRSTARDFTVNDTTDKEISEKISKLP